MLKGQVPCVGWEGGELMATIAELMVKLSMDDGAFQRNLRSSRRSWMAGAKSFRGGAPSSPPGDHADPGGQWCGDQGWASDLEQTLGATEVLWGDNTDTMLAWAQGADCSMV